MEQGGSQAGTMGGIAAVFAINIAAARVLGLEIARIGDDHDQTVARNFLAALGEIIPGRSGVSKEEENQGGDHLGGPPDSAGGPGVERALALLRASKALAKRGPIQGVLLREGALTTLVTFFEALVSDLLHMFFRNNPRALPDSHKVTLAELRALSSIASAEKYLASKEIDELLHGSLTDQLGYFTKKLHGICLPGLSD